MANAKVCDRCGNFYIKNLANLLRYDKRTQREVDYNPFGRYQVGIVHDNVKADTKFDLCDDCLIAFNRFMNITEKEETLDGEETVQSGGGSV